MGEIYNCINKKPLHIETVFVAFLIVLTAACTFQEEMEPPAHLKQQNLTVYSKPENPDTVLLEPEQTYSSTDEAIIGGITWIVSDNIGRVFFADNKHKRIHVFRPDGTYLTSLGREGRGPGEFNYISSIKIVSNQLLAIGARMSRVNMFSLDSVAFSGDVNIRPKNISEIEELSGAIPSQYFIIDDKKLLVGFRWPVSEKNVDKERYSFYYFLDTNGVLSSERVMKLKERIFFKATKSDLLQFPTYSFTPHSEVALSNDHHIYTAWTEDFLVKVRSSDGNYLRSFYYPFKKVPIDRDRLLDDYSNEHHRRLLRNVDLPETWPALNSLIIDDQNRLWVSTIVDDFDVYQWWVIEDSGELVARFTWPRNKQIKEIKNGKLYTRETEEETGLQNVVRYNIEIE